MTKGKKVFVVSLMAAMVLTSAFFLISNPIVKYVVLAAGAVGCIVVIFFVPNAKKD
jgi:amino acid permease